MMPAAFQDGFNAEVNTDNNPGGTHSTAQTLADRQTIRQNQQISS